MTRQEIFDTVSKHLIQQGHQAVGGSSCRYRIDDSKCAVGCLIPDEAYTEEMEGLDVRGLLDQYAQKLPVWMATNYGLLGDLQVVHDSPHTWERPNTLLKELFGVAKAHDLSPAVLNA